LSPILGVLASGITKSKIAVGAYESIASASGTGSSGTITFSSIPSTYKSLQIRGLYRVVAGGDITIMRFNSVSTTSYTRHDLYGDGSTVTAQGFTTTSIFLGPNTAITATNPGVFIADIHNYASTTQNKTTRIFSGVDENGSGSVNLSSGLFNDTSAITSLSIILKDGGSFDTSTRMALYGIKGA